MTSAITRASLMTMMLVAGCSKAEPGTAGGAPRERAVPVMTATVQKRNVPIYLDGLGSVIAYRTVTLRAQVDGKLDQVQFKEGQPVKQGQVLAQIDPRPYLNQLHQAQGQLARDQATLDMNRRNLERYQDLVKNNLIAAQQADDQEGLVAQNEAAMVSDQAAIDVARLNLDYARIVSPIDGVAGIRNIDPGNIIHAAEAAGIVTLTQLDPIAVIFALPQDMLADIAKQQAVSPLEVVIFDSEGSTELGRGHLDVIDNTINSATATLRLKAVMDNPGHALWPNAMVKARLILMVRHDVLVIPAAAVQRAQEGSYVYVVNDEHVKSRTVVIDRLQGEDALLASGLEADEVIVTEGQNQLRPDSKVSLRNPGDKHDAGKAGAQGPQASEQKP